MTTDKPSAGELADHFASMPTWRDAGGEVCKLGVVTVAERDLIVRVLRPPVAGAEVGVMEALEPFLRFASGTMFTRLPDDFVLTAGSRLAHRQLTAGDFRKLQASLSPPVAERGKLFGDTFSAETVVMDAINRGEFTDLPPLGDSRRTPVAERGGGE